MEDSDEILGGYNPIEWYEPFMNFHESEAGPAISYDFVRFFMNIHENEAVRPFRTISYDFFMNCHEIEAGPANFVRNRTLFHEFS